MTTIDELHRKELAEAWANDEQQKRHQAEDAGVEARSALAYAEQTIERHRLEHGELARHVADLTHELIAAEQRAKDAEAKVAELERQYADQVSFDELHGEFMREIAAKIKARENNSRLIRRIVSLDAEIAQLREALAAVMVPIEALAAAGEDAWELAPEVRAELLAARAIGRAAFDKDKKP